MYFLREIGGKYVDTSLLLILFCDDIAFSYAAYCHGWSKDGILISPSYFEGGGAQINAANHGGIIVAPAGLEWVKRDRLEGLNILISGGGVEAMRDYWFDDKGNIPSCNAISRIAAALNYDTSYFIELLINSI